jgi:hypothetical protein
MTQNAEGGTSTMKKSPTWLLPIIFLVLGLGQPGQAGADGDGEDPSQEPDVCLGKLVATTPIEDDFGYPASLASYDSGKDQHSEPNIILTDTANHQVYWARGQGDDIDLSVIAGTGAPGYQDTERDPVTGEIVRAAQFNHPTGVVVGPDGTVYVSDTGNKVLRKIDPDGTVTTIAGVPGESGTTDADVGRAARFSQPRGLAVGRLGGRPFLFTADKEYGRIRTIALDDAAYPVATLDRFQFRNPTSVDYWAPYEIIGYDEFQVPIRRLSQRGTLFVVDDDGIYGVTENEDGSLTRNQIAPGTRAKSVFSDDALNLIIVPQDRTTVERIGFLDSVRGYEPTPTPLRVCGGTLDRPQMAIPFIGGIVAADTGNGRLELFFTPIGGGAIPIRTGPTTTGTPRRL